MKKVVCIDDSNQNELPNCHYVKKGKIYTVVEVYKCPIRKRDYYQFIETGVDTGYFTGMFIEIEDDQLDETEMVKQRNENFIAIP